jgi:diguanylate cyclase (GGDEF)-like protein
MDIAGLAEVLAESLKEISSSGKNLTLANLSRTLAKRKDVEELLERANSREKPVKESELESLKKFIEASENKRKEMFRQLTELEDQAAREKDFHKRLASTLISISDIPANEAFHTVLEECRSVIQNGADLERREEILKHLKDCLLREDIGGMKKPEREEASRKAAKGKSIFGRGEKQTPEDIFQRMKDESVGMLGELQKILGEDFRASIHLAEEHVSKSRDLDSLVAQKTYILSVIEGFVQRSMQEKDQATAFLKEVSERLLDMEKEVFSSTTASAEVHLESSRFNDGLETEITLFRENVLTSTDFENLRAFVITQLSKISSVLHKHREEYVVRIERAQQESENTKKNFRTLIGRVIDKNKTLLEEIQRDSLTEIFNRRTYEISLAAEFERYTRYHTPFSLVFFDVDHFKNVNDRYGHEAGDRVLRAISRKVRDILRKPDIFARYGGEEFVVILPETGLDDAISVARKIRELVENTVFEYEGNRVPITISLGVTETASGDADPLQITLRADKFLYRAKTEGRNRAISDYDVK